MKKDWWHLWTVQPPDLLVGSHKSRTGNRYPGIVFRAHSPHSLLLGLCKSKWVLLTWVTIASVAGVLDLKGIIGDHHFIFLSLHGVRDDVLVLHATDLLFSLVWGDPQVPLDEFCFQGVLGAHKSDHIQHLHGNFSVSQLMLRCIHSAVLERHISSASRMEIVASERTQLFQAVPAPTKCLFSLSSCPHSFYFQFLLIFSPSSRALHLVTTSEVYVGQALLSSTPYFRWWVGIWVGGITS